MEVEGLKRGDSSVHERRDGAGSAVQGSGCSMLPTRRTVSGRAGAFSSSLLTKRKQLEDLSSDEMSERPQLQLSRVPQEDQEDATAGPGRCHRLAAGRKEAGSPRREGEAFR